MGQTLAHATSSGVVTESIEYPSEQPEMKISLKGMYEKKEIPHTTRYPNGLEIKNCKTIITFNPFDQPLLGTSELTIGDKVVSYNQKVIPFFLIGNYPCYDEFISLLCHEVYLEGILEQSNDLFFFRIPQIHLDYVVDSKWKNESCETLPYGPEKITLEGKIHSVTYPGPPEYLSVENGDAPEISWTLTLEKPIHVGKEEEEEEEDINCPEKYVIEVSLLPPDDFVVSTLSEKKVKVMGSLFHAHTAHHCRRVLCDATRIDIIQE